jgi:transcription elongation factor Elf1
MRCPKCGGRRFSIVAECFQTIEYDVNDDVISCEVEDLGDTILERGFLCLACDAEFKVNELVPEKGYKSLCPICKTELEHIFVRQYDATVVKEENVFGCPKCGKEVTYEEEVRK